MQSTNIERLESEILNADEHLNQAAGILNAQSSQNFEESQEWSFKDKRRVRPYQKPQSTMLEEKTPPRNESTPGGHSDQVEEAAARIATTLAATIEASLRQQPRQLTHTLPEYHGHDFEDPRDFARKLNKYFNQAHITDEYEKVAVAGKQLRLDAARWYSLYKDLPLDYGTFLQRLDHKFNSTSVLALARSKLYGETQEQDEPVSLFVMRKRTLFSRLDPAVPEGIMIDTIIEQLQPEIRSRLRAYNFMNIEDLLNIATQIESDLKIIQGRVRIPPNPYRAQRPNPPPANVNAERPRAPNTCRRCNHAHLYVDCPLRRQENQQRADRQPQEAQRGPERSAQP